MRLAHFAHFFAPFIFITAQLAQAKPASSLPAASPKSACPEPVWPAHPSKDESCPATGHSSAHSCPHRHVAASYFAGWHADDPTVNLTTSFRKYNTIIFAVIPTTSNPKEIEIDVSSQKTLSKLVDDCHKNDVCPVAAIGGWTGSRFFSLLVSPHFRRTYARSVVTFVKKYNLCGVDFDWEYPCTKGSGCNHYSKHDSKHFLWFLQELRSLDGAQDLIVSAAVPLTPFLNATGSPMQDVSEFVPLLSWINLMVYDIWGSWSATTGPNAALNDSCAVSQNQQGSAVLAVQNWEKAGFPRSKMVLGVPAYGRLFNVTSKNALDASGKLQPYALFDKANPPAGDKWDSTASGVDGCGNPNTVGSIMHPWSMVDDGWITPSGDPAPGIEYTYDCCSQTPTAYNSTTQEMLSYDDPTSFRAKGKFIKNAGLCGFAMWETAGDFKDILLDAIRDGTGAGFYQ